jgi:hypothetical protein
MFGFIVLGAILAAVVEEAEEADFHLLPVLKNQQQAEKERHLHQKMLVLLILVHEI